MRRDRLLDTGLKVFFVFSLCLLTLLYGVLAGRYQLFPYGPLADAKQAAQALIDVATEEAEEEAAETKSPHTEPVVRNHAGIDDGALILVSGGPGYFENLSPDGGCLAWLMDREGDIKHVWRYPSDLWDDLEHVGTVPGYSVVYVLGVHLLPDGGLIASFQGRHTWPFSIGIVRMDRDSNVLWKKENFAHHWFTVTPEETIITPTLRILDSPQPIGDTAARIDQGDGKIFDDMLTTLSLDGEVLEEVSMLDAVHGSGVIGLYQSASANPYHIDIFTQDPLHLNDVQLVGQQVAAAHGWLDPDDLLVSFRNINAVGILDRQTHRLKWYSAGTMLRQHSPRFWGRDSVLVFDNLGGNESHGGTRLARIDLRTGLAQTVFPPEDGSGPEVRSGTAGHLDVHPQGKAVLMAVTHQATIFEVDPNTGELLWEYLCVDPVTHEERSVYTAKYCYDVDFKMNRTSED